MPSEIVYNGLGVMAPGPAVAGACLARGASSTARRLDSATARGLYTLNRTPARVAARVIAACTDAGFLADVVARERRSTLVEAALRNPCCMLGTVIEAAAGDRPGTGSLTWRLLTDSAQAAARRAVDDGGLMAVVAQLVVVEGRATTLARQVVANLTGLLADVEAFTMVLDADAGSRLPWPMGSQPVAAAVALLCVERREWPLIEALAGNRALLVAHPDVAEAILEACARDLAATAGQDSFSTNARGALHALAGGPHSQDLLGSAARGDGMLIETGSVAWFQA